MFVTLSLGKSCKVLKVWPELNCNARFALQDALHSEICLHWHEGNRGSTPSSVAQSCGTFRQGEARDQEAMLKVDEGLCDPTYLCIQYLVHFIPFHSISRWVHPNVG